MAGPCLVEYSPAKFSRSSTAPFPSDLHWHKRCSGGMSSACNDHIVQCSLQEQSRILEPAVMEFLCIDFLNSEWYDGRGHVEDRLQIESWRKGFLQRWGFSQGTNFTTPQPGEMKSLLRLRALLRVIVSQVAAGRSLSASGIDDLN